MTTLQFPSHQILLFILHVYPTRNKLNAVLTIVKEQCYKIFDHRIFSLFSFLIHMLQVFWNVKEISRRYLHVQKTSVVFRRFGMFVIRGPA